MSYKTISFLFLFSCFPYFASAQNLSITKKTSSKKLLCKATTETPIFKHKTDQQITDKLNNKVNSFIKGLRPSSNLCKLDIIYSGEYISDTLVSIPFSILEKNEDIGPTISNTATLNLIISEDSSEVISAPSKIPQKNLPSIESLCSKYLKSAIASSGIKDSLPEPPKSCNLVESSTYAFSEKGTIFFIPVETYSGVTISSMAVFDLEVLIPYKELNPSTLLFGIK